MEKLQKTLALLLMLFLVLSFLRTTYAYTYVSVKFVYWDPRTDPQFCETCEVWINRLEEYFARNETVNRIKADYGGKALFEWIDFYSSAGALARIKYNLWKTNSLVISGGDGNYSVFDNNFNETLIRETIDAYLAGVEPPVTSNPLSFFAALGLAFSFGFFDTVSPCLIILLSFALSYSLGKATKFKEGFLQVMSFGIGFVLAALFLGLMVVYIYFSLPTYQIYITWAICIFAIVFGLNSLGLNLLGFLKINVETKPVIQKLAKRLVFTYGGLLVLGFLFYFLDPCIAPIFFAMVPLLTRTDFLILILVFCLGMILPFIGIGLFTGSISKLVRTTYRHRTILKAISGLILIGYALYLIYTLIL